MRRVLTVIVAVAAVEHGAQRLRAGHHGLEPAMVLPIVPPNAGSLMPRPPSCSRPGRAWQPARLAAAPAGTLAPMTGPAIMAFGPESVASVKQPAPGVFLYSFPRNTAAQLRVGVTGGKAADRIRFRCGEHKNAQDRLFGGYIVGSDLITDGQSLAHQ